MLLYDILIVYTNRAVELGVCVNQRRGTLTVA